MDGERSKIERVLPIAPGLKTLDVGAGVGKFMKVSTNLGFDAYGIEPSKSFFDYAVNSMNIPAERLQNKPVEEAYFSENFFDFISFSAVMEHLPDPNYAIQCALRWVRSGGFIYISVPSSRWLMSRVFNFYFKWKNTDYVTNLSPMHLPFHLYEFDIRSFEKNAAINHYSVHQYNYSVCETFMPKIFDGIVEEIYEANRYRHGDQYLDKKARTKLKILKYSSARIRQSKIETGLMG